jgi:hypothetical protein
MRESKAYFDVSLLQEAVTLVALSRPGGTANLQRARHGVAIRFEVGFVWVRSSNVLLVSMTYRTLRGVFFIVHFSGEPRPHSGSF